MSTISVKTDGNIIEENKRFEAFFQYASMGILMMDSGGMIQLANNFLVHQFGYDDSSEIIGKKVEVLIPARFHNHHTAYRNKYIEDPRPRPMGIGKDLFAVRKNGTEFPVEISLSNYHTDGEQFAIAFVRDRKSTRLNSSHRH